VRDLRFKRGTELRQRGIPLLNLALLLWSALSLIGCGGSSMEGATAAAPEAAGQYQSYSKLSSPPAAQEAGDGTYRDGAYGYEADFDQRIEAPKKTAPSGKPGGSEAQEPPFGDDIKGKGLNAAEALIVYTGFLHLRVRRVLDTVDAITKETEQRGGYIESLSSEAIVVRVPSKDFDGVMAIFSGLGEVLDRNIKAQDVTEKFTDLGARLNVAKEARARLLALLATEKDVKERLTIVAEVKRLTEQIEGIESTLATLQNLVDFFTITIRLTPLLENSRTATYESPFAWIRALSPYETTLPDGKFDDFTLTPPKGFVLFDEDDEFHARSADTSVLRCAKIENEPLADNTFWGNAVQHEMAGRGEKLVESGKSGRMAFQVFVNDDIKPRYYLVAVATNEDDLFVAEIFFPNAEAFKLHRADAISALTSFQPE
jgi:hypothetical protein